MANLDIQKQEIAALKSIFEKEIFMVDEEKLTGRFLCHVKLPSKNFVVKYSSEESGDGKQFEVEHLLPFELQFEFPETYPSSACPKFSLSCPWLSPSDSTSLCRKLEDIWVTSHSEILFTWFSFLQDEALSHLKYDCLDISDLIRDASPPESVSHAEEYDPRVIFSHPGVELVNNLVTYSARRRDGLFNNQWQRCIICMTPNKGQESVRFDCDHITCRDCLSGYFQVQIDEGNIHELKCPEFKCGKLAPNSLIASLVSEEKFKRYEQLVRVSVVDSMIGVVFCPRVDCKYPAIPDESSRLVTCAECRFAYCSNCNYAFHGVSPCKEFRSPADRRKIMATYHEATPEEKEEMESYYGKELLEQNLIDYLTEEYLGQRSKLCPSCSSKIEKDMGCDYMLCWKCKAPFCWRCLKVLRQEHESHDCLPWV
ncbi:E3 ubiquitin-protein ligase RNF14 [Halotydeus destructor]|nr:E3 ubiquitin-protein ligase RNF14 [Halotydeus destructor]